MNWKFWETKASQPSTRSVYIDSLTNEFLFDCLTNEKITPQKAFKFYGQNSSVATAVDIIADTFEQIKPILMLADGSIVDEHPIVDLLKNPNSHMTWNDFASRIARHSLLTNQTHFYGMGAVTLPPTEIHPVKPINVTATTGGDGYVDMFNIGSGIGRGEYDVKISKQRVSRYYDGPLKEIYRIAGFSSMPTDGTADSPLQAASLEANQQIKGRIHNMKIIDNGGRLSLLVVFKDEHMSDDEHLQRSERLNDTFAGEENAGKIAVLSGGDVETVQEMGITQKDMDFAELDQIAGRSIYSRYHIPLPLISNKASTFNNLATGIEMLYDMATLPLADKLFQGLTRFLLPRYGIDLKSGMKITYNPESLQPLKARKLKELKERKETGLETINEIRESMPNRKDVEGGDVLYQNAAYIPLGTDLNEPEPRTVDEP